MTTKLKVGDHVYWKMRAGMYYRTICGTITAIDKEIATIVSSTQNTYGKQYSKRLDSLTKSK